MVIETLKMIWKISISIKANLYYYPKIEIKSQQGKCLYRSDKKIYTGNEKNK